MKTQVTVTVSTGSAGQTSEPIIIENGFVINCQRISELEDAYIVQRDAKEQLVERIAELEAEVRKRDDLIESQEQAHEYNMKKKAQLQAQLDAVRKAAPKLNRMLRMPNTEWVADEHNAAVEKIHKALEQKE